ncbi:MAG: metallophosphoesterase [Ruminococcus sp.]|jgi:predicted MPP superfamily phosphohydrolase
MTAVFLSPVYLLINGYLVWRLFCWMSAVNTGMDKIWIRFLVMAVYLFFASALLVGFLLPPGELQRFFMHIGNYWLGVLAYAVMVILAAELLGLILKRCGWLNQEKIRSSKTFAIAGCACILIVAAVSIWGVINARMIRTTDYEITVQKKTETFHNMKVVLAADLHMGYNIGCRQMEQMVEKINRENPDLVVIAGDIFDNEYEALKDPEKLISILQGIKSRYGIYACYGNHDIQEKILAGFTFKGEDKKQSDIRMDEFLEKAGITLLQDEAVLIENEIYLYGRPDASRPGRGIEERKSPKEITDDMDLSRPVFVIDHQPRELQKLADAGVDLDLCGHTHDGQIFPGNILTSIMWENSCGYLKKDDMHNIVTSGVGVFGPNMRVGTKAEICSITVHFEGRSEKES